MFSSIKIIIIQLFVAQTMVASLINSRKISMLAEKTVNNNKQPWEIGRFLRTANFYGALKIKIPFLPNFRKSETKKISVNELLWDSESKNVDSDLVWGPLDDVGNN